MIVYATYIVNCSRQSILVVFYSIMDTHEAMQPTEWNYIRQRFTSSGVTVSELARRTGIPQPSLSRYMVSATPPSHAKFVAIASALGLSVRVIPMITAYLVHPCGGILSETEIVKFMKGKTLLGYSEFPAEARLVQPGGGILLMDQPLGLVETEADAVRLKSFCQGNLPNYKWDYEQKYFNADRINWRRPDSLIQ